jgi:diguanylate cyclase (GGDEF)-like protein/PAS domain S-box-containing protein
MGEADGSDTPRGDAAAAGKDDGFDLAAVLLAASADLTTLSTLDGSYLYVSPVCRSMLGREPADLVGRTADDFVHPDDVDVARAARTAAKRGAGVAVARHRLACADGRYLWTESALRAVRLPGGDETLLLTTVRDIAERTVAESRLEHQALTDPLTGIANRTVFMDRLGLALRRLHRSSGLIAVIYLDLDHFKVINDSLGHSAGDELLLKVAERTLRSLRPSDTLARLGGDEFVVLAEGLGGVPEAMALAERICAAVESPFELEGESFVCTVSAGVATTTDPGQLPEGLLQEADLALYRAKAAGRNRAAVFDEELRFRAVRRLATEQMVRLALAEQRLALRFQPVIDLTDGRVVEAEALVRVRNGDTLVPAADFIEVAEEAGVLPAIDAWVLPRALHQAASWRREWAKVGFAGVSINVSARQLADTKLVQAVGEALDTAEVDGSGLCVEMNERVLMEATNSAMSNLRAIRDLGVRVGIDNFGTGYSSLSYLRWLPLDFIKVDASLVAELGRSARDTALVGGLVDLCHALGLVVVAKGVGSATQAEALLAVGCDRAQGHGFGAAVEPAELVAFIREGAGSSVRTRRARAPAPT